MTRSVPWRPCHTMGAQNAGQDRSQTSAFRLEEATIDELHAAIRAGATTCVAVVQHYIARVRAFNGVASMLVTEDGAPVPEATGAVRARRAAEVPDADREGLHHPARSRQVQRPAARIRPHGADRVRSRRAAAVRHDRRHSERRPGQCARHAQHPRRALGHLPGRVRPASVARAAAARRAAGVRILPPAARCAGARRRARRDLRPQSRPREDADVRRRVLVQGSVRHQGHALDRRRRRRLRHRFPGARPRAGRAAAQQGRDHLRQGGQHRIQRPRRRSGRPQQARQGAAVDARLSAQHLGAAIRPIPTTPRARPRSARVRARACRSAPTW